ncbi:MAG: hypothetical protein HQL52_10735 [Magnetococcales bacterium]|nr:hypothetical protein [Magnetococcales bacterium]
MDSKAGLGQHFGKAQAKIVIIINNQDGSHLFFRGKRKEVSGSGGGFPNNTAMVVPPKPFDNDIRILINTPHFSNNPLPGHGSSSKKPFRRNEKSKSPLDSMDPIQSTPACRKNPPKPLPWDATVMARPSRVIFIFSNNSGNTPSPKKQPLPASLLPRPNRGTSSRIELD